MCRRMRWITESSTPRRFRFDAKPCGTTQTPLGVKSAARFCPLSVDNTPSRLRTPYLECRAPRAADTPGRAAIGKMTLRNCLPSCWRTLQPFDDYYNQDPLLTRCLRPQYPPNEATKEAAPERFW